MEFSERFAEIEYSLHEIDEAKKAFKSVTHSSKEKDLVLRAHLMKQIENVKKKHEEASNRNERLLNTIDPQNDPQNPLSMMNVDQTSMKLAEEKRKFMESYANHFDFRESILEQKIAMKIRETQIENQRMNEQKVTMSRKFDNIANLEKKLEEEQKKLDNLRNSMKQVPTQKITEDMNPEKLQNATTPTLNQTETPKINKTVESASNPKTFSSEQGQQLVPQQKYSPSLSKSSTSPLPKQVPEEDEYDNVYSEELQVRKTKREEIQNNQSQNFKRKKIFEEINLDGKDKKTMDQEIRNSLKQLQEIHISDDEEDEFDTKKKGILHSARANIGFSTKNDQKFQTKTKKTGFQDHVELEDSEDEFQEKTKNEVSKRKTQFDNFKIEVENDKKPTNSAKINEKFARNRQDLESFLNSESSEDENSNQQKQKTQILAQNQTKQEESKQIEQKQTKKPEIEQKPTKKPEIEQKPTEIIQKQIKNDQNSVKKIENPTKKPEIDQKPKQKKRDSSSSSLTTSSELGEADTEEEESSIFKDDSILTKKQPQIPTNLPEQELSVEMLSESSFGSKNRPNSSTQKQTIQFKVPSDDENDEEIQQNLEKTRQKIEEEQQKTKESQKFLEEQDEKKQKEEKEKEILESKKNKTTPMFDFLSKSNENETTTTNTARSGASTARKTTNLVGTSTVLGVSSGNRPNTQNLDSFSSSSASNSSTSMASSQILNSARNNNNPTSARSLNSARSVNSSSNQPQQQPASARSDANTNQNKRKTISGIIGGIFGNKKNENLANKREDSPLSSPDNSPTNNNNKISTQKGKNQVSTTIANFNKVNNTSIPGITPPESANNTPKLSAYQQKKKDLEEQKKREESARLQQQQQQNNVGPSALQNLLNGSHEESFSFLNKQEKAGNNKTSLNKRAKANFEFSDDDDGMNEDF